MPTTPTQVTTPAQPAGPYPAVTLDPTIDPATGRPYTGRFVYGLGLFGFTPIPFLSVPITTLAMLLGFTRAKKRGSLSHENGRRAANWGLSYLLYGALALALFACGFMLQAPDADPSEIPALSTIGFIAMGLLGVTHLVVTIMGSIQTGRGNVFINKLAIPFIRAKK